MLRKPHVLIAGAGIGGLTAALALLQKGFDVDVYEQAPELKEVGAGVQIGPNGTRVLFALGLRREMERIGTEPRGKQVRLWNTGEARKMLDLGAASVQRYGYPYYTLHRADFQEGLAQAVRREKRSAVHLGARCAGFSQSAEGLELCLGSGEVAAGDVLIGADGVHSRVRQLLFGADRPRFTGSVGWRGLIPAAHLPRQIPDGLGVLWVGPGAHVVHYPVRRGDLLNFFGCVARDDWQIESWSARGTTEECAADFAGWHDDVRQLVSRIAVPYKWALIVREPLPRWSRGRVTLLGDACHSTLPFLAQGANMAVEDGYMLARCLEQCEDDIQAGLALYEQVRRPRAERVVRVSAEQAERIQGQTLADPAASHAHLAAEWSEEQVRERYDWLYQYDATTAPLN